MAFMQVIPIEGFKAIVAVSLNGCIGKEGKLPWHLPQDLKWFKETTTGGTLVMGSKTYRDVGVLPNRGLVVVSRKAVVDGCCAFDVPPDRLVGHVQMLAGDGHRVWLCGGAQTYKTYLPWCEELYVTLVRQVVEGDAFFPPISAREFRVVEVLRDEPEFQIVRMRNAALFSDGLRD